MNTMNTIECQIEVFNKTYGKKRAITPDVQLLADKMLDSAPNAYLERIVQTKIKHLLPGALQRLPRRGYSEQQIKELQR